MPNMYRSPSIETYGEHIVLRDTSYMIEGYTGIPVKGTIAKGYLSTFNYGKDTIGSDSLFLLAGDRAAFPEDFSKDSINLKFFAFKFFICYFTLINTRFITKIR